MTLRSDPTASKKGTTQKCREASSNVNQSIIGLLTSVGTRNTPGQQSAMQSKVNHVRSSLEGLRASINVLPGIDSDIETQALRIAALQEQMQLKNDFILSIRQKQASDFFTEREKPVRPEREEETPEESESDENDENDDREEEQTNVEEHEEEEEQLNEDVEMQEEEQEEIMENEEEENIMETDEIDENIESIENIENNEISENDENND